MKSTLKNAAFLAAACVAMLATACSEQPAAEVVEAPAPVVEDTTPKEPEIPAVTIGENEWMANNADKKTSASFCFDDDPELCDTYGRLYTWAAAQRACPKGWHLATDEDWEDMIEALGGEREATIAIIEDEELGFGAKMGGSRTITGKYSNLDLRGTFWTATKLKKQHAWCRIVRFQEGDILRKRANVDAAFSCRCVKDAEPEAEATAAE